MAHLPPEEEKQHYQGVVSEDMKTSSTSGSSRKDPVAGSGDSVTDNALQSPEAKMVASGAISKVGKNLGTFCVPENQLCNLQGGRGPGSLNPELGRARPWTRSQGEVAQLSKGATSSSGNPAQVKSSGSGKQPSQDLARKCSGGPQLLETTESPSTPQPPYYLRSHRFESQQFSGPSLSTTIMSHVSSPVSKARSQIVQPVSGHHSSTPEFSLDDSGHTTPASQGHQQQDTLQVPDPDLCHRESEFSPDPEGGLTVGGWVLRSRATASGHHSSALEVSAAACSSAHDTKATLQDPVTHSTTLGHSPGIGSPETQGKVHQASRSGSAYRRRRERRAKTDPGHSSQTRENPYTSGTAFPKRTLKATKSSPPRRPVRMRASSPSPPGRRYPFPGLYNEVFRSSPDLPNVSSPPSSPIRSTDQTSSPCASATDSRPDKFWPALIPDLDNLNALTSEEFEDIVGIKGSPHSSP